MFQAAETTMMDDTSHLFNDHTADLHRTRSQEAIQDTFESTTLKHPGRLCVIEIASDSSPHRESTDRRIQQASNVLAHHLVQHRTEK